MSFRDTLDRYQVEPLAERVVLLRKVAKAAGPGSNRKGDLVAYLANGLRRKKVLEAIWQQLGETDRRFVSAAVAEGGQADLDAFTAQFGSVPRSLQGTINEWRLYTHRKLGLLDLLFFDPRPWHWDRLDLEYLRIPDELLGPLAAIAPAPEKFRLEGVADPPDHLELEATEGEAERLPLIQADTERAGWHDLRNHLALVRAGELRHSKAKGDLTAGSVRKVLAGLLDGDLLDLGDTLKESVRPYGLDTFARGAGLLEAAPGSGHDYRLTARGAAVLEGDPEALLEGFEAWADTGEDDEFTRVKGLRRVPGAELTPPEDRRAQLVEALSWCPAGVWLPTGELHRALRAWRFDVTVLEDPAGLYLTGVSGSKLTEFTPRTAWALAEGRYVNTVLFEVLAPIGAVDVLYVSPDRLSVHTGPWTTPHLALGDGLWWFRINPLGAYLFGQAGAYSPPQTRGLVVAEDLTVTIAGETTPLIAQRLAAIAVAEDAAPGPGAEEPGGQSRRSGPPPRYRLDTETLLASLESGLAIEDARSLLREGADEPLPAEVEAWLDRVGRNRGALAVAGAATVLRVREPEVLELIESDAALGNAVHAVAGDTVVVAADQEDRFRKLLRARGYGIV